MPPDYVALKQEFHEHTYLMTVHASDRGIQRDIAAHEIEVAVIGGEIIEDYPNDKYGPSCLILGKTETGRILHIQVSYPPDVKVITLYEPSPNEWETDWKTRKNNE